MEIQIENLKAKMRGVELNSYQTALALDEFKKLIIYTEALEQQLRQYNVNRLVPSDDRIVAEAIIAARKVNPEVNLSPNNNDIRMFCLGAKWMRDFTHSNER